MEYPDSPEAYLQAATLCDEHLDRPELAYCYYDEYLRLIPESSPDRETVVRYREAARKRLLQSLGSDEETERLKVQVAKLRAAVLAQQRQLAALNRRAEAAQAPAPAPSSGGERKYIVKSGDYPEKIARAHRVSLRELLRANGLDVNSKLRIGQELIIPPAGVSGQ